MEVKVANCPSQDLALTNCLFVHPQTFALLGGDASGDLHCEVKHLAYAVKPSEKVEAGCVGMNSIQRRNASVSQHDIVTITVFSPTGPGAPLLSSISMEADFVVKKAARGTETMDGAALVQSILTRFSQQFFTVGQSVVVDFQGSNLLLKVGPLEAVAVSDKGELYSWGAGRDGKLGHGDAAQQPRPRRVGGALGSRRCTHCSAGDGHSLVVADGGQLFSFGLGDFGRLGHGDERSRHTPECVRALRGLAVVQASAGFYHSAVVVRGGQVYAFGDGAFGKLAAGSTEDQLLPVRMQLAIGWSGVEIAEVAAGYQHTAIRTSAGVVLTCGIGWKGQLGCGDLREDQRVPIAVCRSLDTPPLQLRYASVLQRWGAASATPGGSPTGVRSAAPPRLAPGGYRAIGLGLAPHDDW